MLITMSGTPGSGKTTVARLLSAQLRLPHIYAGDLFRQAARDRGLSLEAFNRLAEGDHSIDRELDARMAEYVRQGGSILEGRLAGFLAEQEQADALKVWVTASEETRARRVAGREASDWRTVLEQNRVRQRSDTKRYHDIYGFDLSDTAIYDVILESDNTSPEDLAAAIVQHALQRFGGAPIPGASR